MAAIVVSAMKETVFLMTWHIICKCKVGMQTIFMIQAKRGLCGLDPKW